MAKTDVPKRAAAAGGLMGVQWRRANDRSGQWQRLKDVALVMPPAALAVTYPGRGCRGTGYVEDRRSGCSTTARASRGSLAASGGRFDARTHRAKAPPRHRAHQRPSCAPRRRDGEAVPCPQLAEGDIGVQNRWAAFDPLRKWRVHRSSRGYFDCGGRSAPTVAVAAVAESAKHALSCRH
jgi:hypothetical protein